jgi:RHS repeat-associated protein
MRTDPQARRLIRTAGHLRPRDAERAWNGRRRLRSRTFPQTDREVFTFDGRDNVTLLTQVTNTGSGLAKTLHDANGLISEVDKGTTNAAGTTFTALETTLTAFDQNGNKTQVSVLNGPSGSTPLTVTQTSYDPMDLVICTGDRQNNATVAGVTHTYDKFGNLTSDGTWTFAYDTENRLLTESGSITMALSYDSMGRLQQSVINGTTTQFLYDGDALVGEYLASGNTPLRRYVRGAGTDNPLIWYEGGTMTSATANHLVTDRQGSIVATAGSSGALNVNYTYDAYGAPGAWGTVGTVPRFRYTGQAAIPEPMLYHYEARVYDAVSGRFLQTDPVGYGPDVNWYVYVGDDPINDADPTCLGPRDFEDISAKCNRGYKIAQDELHKFRSHCNDKGDAFLHATWPYRMARNIDPLWATIFGTWHELKGTM